MNPLIRAFFERDLTPAEKDQLGEMLKASPEEAMGFMDLAAQAYARTGLPEPKWTGKDPRPRSGGGSPSPGSRPQIPWETLRIVGTLIFALLFGWLAWKGPEIFGEKAAPPALSLPDETAPIRSPIKKRRAPATRKAPTPVTPERYIRGRAYNGLLAVVDKPARGSTRVRVVDPSNREVRRLYDGMLEKGAWVFHWDGLLANGRASASGKYAIEVSSNGRVLRRIVQVGPEPPVAPGR